MWHGNGIEAGPVFSLVPCLKCELWGESYKNSIFWCLGQLVDIHKTINLLQTIWTLLPNHTLQTTAQIIRQNNTTQNNMGLQHKKNPSLGESSPPDIIEVFSLVCGFSNLVVNLHNTTGSVLFSNHLHYTETHIQTRIQKFPDKTKRFRINFFINCVTCVNCGNKEWCPSSPRQ